ncbi:MAG: ribonuclease HII [Rhodothermales bacterium]|nr:ribonuclease HII [Rhodothermales bacterium]
MNPETLDTLFSDLGQPDDGPEKTRIERHLWSRGVHTIAGVDEAGRGCLAGPVVAAAVILPVGADIDGVDDSKTLSEPERTSLADVVRRQAVAVAVAECSAREIDRLNILWASMEAMRRALIRLERALDYVLIDGNTMIPNCAWPARAVVKGDSRSLSIAAASIIAKTHRDRLMREAHERFPEYSWNTNVGYPTAGHYEALRTHGPSPMHRRSFRLE